MQSALQGVVRRVVHPARVPIQRVRPLPLELRSLVEVLLLCGEPGAATPAPGGDAAAQRGVAFVGEGVPEPDVAICGGITVWMKVAHLAEARNLPVTTHGVHDLQVHLLAAIPNASYLEVHGFGLDRFIAEPLVVSEGLATAPDRPGHGVSFDWDGLEALRA